jgi:branched-chain amino acid transport system substrate-binding protein
MKVRSLRIMLALGAMASLSLLNLPPATHAATPVSIALVADVTGASAVYGVSIEHGALLAAALLNKAGGISGHPLDLKVGDAASSETQVVDLFQQYSADPSVLALIGPTLSSEAFKADPLAQQAGLPVVATSNTANGIPQLGSYIFRMSLGEGSVIPLAMQVAERHLHFKKVAILYGNDNALTISEEQIFAATAKKMHLKIVDTETFATAENDFSRQLTKIKEAHPDLILCGALAPAAVPILVQARQLGIPSTVHFLGGNGFNSPAIITGAGKAAEGAIEGTAWYPNSASALNKRFVSAYKAKFDKMPDQFAAQAFDGVNIVAAAIKAAHTTSSRQAVRAALASLQHVPVVTGSSGLFSFTSSRDAGEQGTVQIIQNGRFVAYT